MRHGIIRFAALPVEPQQIIADLAAERAQPAGHAHTIGSTSQPSDASTDDQQLQALVRRLDDALGEDGRLL